MVKIISTGSHIQHLMLGSLGDNDNIELITIVHFNSIHLFTCLTTAKYGQLQPSTKITVQVNIKKQKKHNKGTIRNLKGINQYKSIHPST
jgi:hypothetical protein